MSRLRLTLACGPYDRTRALADGSIAPAGVDLTYLAMSPEEIFFRMLAHGEFDAAEMSLSSYTLSLFGDDPSMIAIPVFPSRAFRHSCIYVHADSDVSEPRQLAGLDVGTPEYQMTAGVWIRGILAEHHGLAVEDVTYRTGGQEEPGRKEKIPLDLPDAIRVDRITGQDTLTQMLADQRIAALYSARAPSNLRPGGPVRRLFADPEAVEREFFAATGIFPIMHVVVLRREIHERHPWVARSLYDAFGAAKRQAESRLADATALAHMDPWLVLHTERTRELMGADFWPYGVEPNAATLSAFLRYSHEQGLAERLLEPEDLFAPETLTAFTV
jgi:4,5-dihydroxyphthalate decarboxylase